MTDDDFKGGDAILSQTALRVLNQLETMHAHIATSGFVDWLARVVDTKGPREMIVHIRDAQANRSSFSFDILRGLEGPLHISCRLANDRLCITARDAANRYVRSITFTFEARVRIISQLAAAVTNDCDVLEMDPETFKISRAVHWAVQTLRIGSHDEEAHPATL
ncbi:hypothetical protein EXIGLDRAFT_760890 [Exidia glandulosa HHB12029]|uniref:Uncharacterized protein n=1 Tax=Exidia glandulosa HHB12029 TaxID=1314781 RepID=A0A165NYJ0_EXIGL|nr:hypothetical protein EXIGLDRAFT_760890 [Exidia glandulosa HHB12029]